MRTARVLLLRLRSLFRQAKVDRELEAELKFHFEQQVGENLAKGMTAAEARREAARAMSGLARVAEECRDARRVMPLIDFARDCRYAGRMLVKNRVFAGVAIATLTPASARCSGWHPTRSRASTKSPWTGGRSRLPACSRCWRA